MKKKFKAVIDDSLGGASWSVWNVTENGSIEYMWAEFFGPGARKYAVDHVNKLSEGVR